MFKSWRLQLREAEEAFRAGRLDEAVRLVQEGQLQQCMPGKRLVVSLAEQLARRAQQRLQQAEGLAGWRDLATASSLGGQCAGVLDVCREVTQQLVGQAEARLAAGETDEAIKRLESLDQHLPGNETVRVLLEVARHLDSGRNLRARGRFEEAEVQLERAAGLRPDLASVKELREICQRQAREARELSEQLHAAMSQSAWTETLALAGRLLEISPRSPLAEDARRRAWLALGAPAPPRIASPSWTPASPPAADAADVDPAGSGLQPSRFVLWVDGVGGFLVCLNDEVVIGQAASRSPVDVPLLADLSRRHAIIRREDHYLIEPLGEVAVEGRTIRRTTVLAEGDEIRLGRSVLLRFRQPHALSATARLDWISSHRSQPSADAILLMAESCVLGPKWQNHIVCRDWSRDVVLYRREGALYCRAMEGIEVDGKFCQGQQRLEWNSHVAGSEFSLSLERVS